ncbi:hypothetical protein MSAN_02137800 [Mycena sanguinolenta]|uniref:F-box domain-containing protein n=1 Tax=Mycena sanguinolenta TaxID=230812 RepID=A0A8H6XGD4_9AGAR|nr:hypothetical protein MSAN_02137800 [Mycena sanguinolenta]
MSASPLFPRELEREIFEICALSQPVFIPKVMLVAQRVKEWIEPLLYRTIVLGFRVPGVPSLPYHIVSSVICRKPKVFFHKAVRHLLVFTALYPTREVDSMLSLCTGVEDIWLFNARKALIPLVRSLPLKRLYVGFESLPSPTLPMFSRLTHLHLRVDQKMNLICAFVEALTALTHLSLTDSFSSDGTAFPMIHRILASSESMQVLIVLGHTPSMWMDAVPPAAPTRYAIYAYALSWIW